MSMIVFKENETVRAFSRSQRTKGRKIGFVPTMGYLHEGHLSLLKAARESCDVVITSIYVNPTQFSKNEDFGVYPKNLERDMAMLERNGCDALFLPSSLYTSPTDQPGGDKSMVVGNNVTSSREAHSTWVEVGYLSEGLCASSRPHFFRGVCTIVTKLFNIIDPDVAFFGRKDFQQYRVIERMVRDLDFDIEVVGIDIVREPDGLAMSSRNALLKVEDRRKATCIYRSLLEAKDAVSKANVLESDPLLCGIRSAIEAQGGVIDYAKAVNKYDLTPLVNIQKGETLLAIAVFFDKVRLIDNIEL